MSHDFPATSFELQAPLAVDLPPTHPPRTLTLRIQPRPYPITFTGSVPWLSTLHLLSNGRQRQVFHPMMEGLGELLSTSRAGQLDIWANSSGSKFRCGSRV